ncbi:hypothetical protein [Neptuniibacter halophilus]|uniref:hypothetical protein n=1 Tax=Neptuniibacter halophilus TaxID=651666 RepID=UPI002573DEE0|nr:hypothetical protein [Neptuniibacter halophilus]
MRKLFFIGVATTMLSGCMALVTKDNASTFETWELCTLLYNPTSLYSDWINIEEENIDIAAELSRRGVHTETQCSVPAIAESKCLAYGFQADTNDFARCRIDVEQHIQQMKQMKKAAHDAQLASEALQAQQIQNSIQLQQIKYEQQRQNWRLQQQPIQY